MSTSAFSTSFSAACCSVGIERREDAQPALVDALPAEALDQLAADLLLEIQAERLLDLERRSSD